MFGLLGADPVRRAQALVGVGRRHPHVHDRDVGLVRADLAHQVLGVAGLADDVEAGLLEQAAQALAQQHGVVGDHDTEGAHERGSLVTGRRLQGSSSWTRSPESSAFGHETARAGARHERPEVRAVAAGDEDHRGRVVARR